MKKFGRNKIALFLACTSVLGGKIQAMNLDEAQTQQTLATVGGGATSNNNSKSESEALMGYKSVTNPASNSLKLDNHSVLLPKSKSMSNLRKGLIVLGAALGFSIATWGTVKLVKYLNNKKQNDGSTPLAGDKLAETRKMMDDALKKDWVIDKSSACHCRVAGHIDGVIDSPKSLNFSLFKKDKNKVPGELDKWVDFHIKEIRETFSENKDVAAFFQTDGQTEDTKKFEYLIFSHNGQIIKIGFIKSTKQLYDLEFAVYDYDKDKCNCCWSFKLNNPK